MERTKIATLAGVAVLATAMVAGQQHADELSRVYGFRVEIEGLEPMPVRVVEGLKIEVVVEEVETPGDPVLRKMPTRFRTGEITLKRGVVDDWSFFDWINLVRVSDTSEIHRDVSVTVLDRQGSDVQTFEYHECFLSSYELVPLDSKSAGEGLEEAVTFACDLVERKG